MFRLDSLLKPNSALANEVKDPLTENTAIGSNKPITTSSATSFSIPMPTNSYGMLMLTCIKEDNELQQFKDVVELLVTQDKAVLLLPVSIPPSSSFVIDKDFIMNHVIVYKDNQVISLNGVRGIFQKDQFIALGLLPSEQEINDLIVDADSHSKRNKNNKGQQKRSLFDTFSLDPSSITPDHPKYNILASHVQLSLKQDQSITVMLLQRPLLKKDIIEWIDTRSKHKETLDTPLNDPLDNQVSNFIKQFKRKPSRTRDTASRRVLALIDELHDLMLSSKEGEENAYTNESQLEVDKRLDKIESYICNQLYDQLFTSPEGDEAMEDEALESRIAALNLLDLNLTHLGVSMEQENVDELNQIIKKAGTQLQQLNIIRGAKEKLDILIKTHEIIVNTTDQNTTRTTVLADSANTEIIQEIISNNKISTVNADILLPILIFTIVKSNPSHFLSNLKFIQRYRRPSKLIGQASYCLTNMMAAVSFLETTNLVGLGLSADKVYSHITDLSGTKISTVDSSPLPTSNQASSSISLKLQQQQNTGLKLVSEVMDSSSKIFDGINKFWQRNAQELVEQHSKRSGGNGTSLIEQMKGRVGSASNSNSSKVNPKEGELKEMTLNNDSMPTISSTSSSTATKPISSSSSSSSLPAFMEERSFSRFRKSKSTATTALLSGEGPIQKFLDMKSVDELKIGEVTELLADYKRLAAMIKQAGLA